MVGSCVPTIVFTIRVAPNQNSSIVFKKSKCMMIWIYFFYICKTRLIIWICSREYGATVFFNKITYFSPIIVINNTVFVCVVSRVIWNRCITRSLIDICSNVKIIAYFYLSIYIYISSIITLPISKYVYCTFLI